jgi:hypothetical protein
MLPLLLEICFPCLLRVNPCVPLNDDRVSRRYSPFPQIFKDAISLGWNDLAGGKKPPKIGMFHKKAGVVL